MKLPIAVLTRDNSLRGLIEILSPLIAMLLLVQDNVSGRPGGVFPKGTMSQPDQSTHLGGKIHRSQQRDHVHRPS
jgi:hypothetical protein